MKLLFPLLTLLSLGIFATWVWLVVIAFKRSPLWGVLMLLFSPISTIVYAVKFWDESRKPFLIYTGSCVGAFACIGLMFAMLGGQVMALANQGADMSPEQMAQLMESQVQAMEDSGMFDEAEQARLREMRKSVGQGIRQGAPVVEPGPADSGTLVVDPEMSNIDPNEPGGRNWLPKVTLTVAPEEPAMVAKGLVSLADARKLVGKLVRVVEVDGKVHRGELTDVKKHSLLVERHLQSGTFAYEIRKRDVESLEGL